MPNIGETATKCMWFAVALTGCLGLAISVLSAPLVSLILYPIGLCIIVYWDGGSSLRDCLTVNPVLAIVLIIGFTAILVGPLIDESSNPNMLETSAMKNLVGVCCFCSILPPLLCCIIVHTLVLSPILFCSILAHELVLRPILFIADKLGLTEASATGEHVYKPQEQEALHLPGGGRYCSSADRIAVSLTNTSEQGLGAS